MAVAKPDLLNLELEAEMLKQVGASLSRVKKRLIDTDLAFHLKPPDTETREIKDWETKIASLINYTEKMPFPKLLDFKRQFAKKNQERAKIAAEQHHLAQMRQHERIRLGNEAGAKMEQFRKNKSFGTLSSHFGGPIPGETLKTIENYAGQNTIYGSQETTRTLIRKDGRLTKYELTSDVPPWVSAGCYANSDPPLFHELPDGVYTLPFKGRGRKQPPRSATLRENKISRRNMLDSWKLRDPGPHYARTPESQSLEWRTSRQMQQNEAQDLKVSGKIDQKVLPSTPKIILGDITRQSMLVELEDAMRAKSPTSTRSQPASPNLHSSTSYTNTKSGAPLTPAAIRLEQQTKYRYSYLHTSQHISAKLARAENPSLVAEQPSGWSGRKDFTYGGLDNAIGLDEDDIATMQSSSHISLPAISTSDNAPVAVSLEQLSARAPSIYTLIHSPKPLSISYGQVGAGLDENGSIASVQSRAIAGKGQGAGQATADTEAAKNVAASRPSRGKESAGKGSAGNNTATLPSLEVTEEANLDPTGIATLPLTSPLKSAIASHLGKYVSRSKPQYRKGLRADAFATSPEISIRGLLLEETESHNYIPPAVSPTERDAMLEVYKDVGLPRNKGCGEGSRSVGSNGDLSSVE